MNTEFAEDISLKQIEMNKEQRTKLQLDELLEEVKTVEAMLDERLDNIGRNFEMSSNTFSTRNGALFKLSLKEGKYLFSVSGFYIDEQLYNGDYYD